MADEIEDTTSDSLKELRARADAAKAAEAEAAKLKRELAFAKAGVDTDTKLGQMLFKTYEGDLTTEAIRAEASEVGAWSDPASGGKTAVENVASEEEQRQAQLRDGLAAGHTATGQEDPDPYAQMRKAAEQARADGLSNEAVFAAGIAPIIEAAKNRDARVLL